MIKISVVHFGNIPPCKTCPLRKPVTPLDRNFNVIGMRLAANSQLLVQRFLYDLGAPYPETLFGFCRNFFRGFTGEKQWMINDQSSSMENE